jgi:hypothetical protein
VTEEFTGCLCHLITRQTRQQEPNAPPFTLP